MFLKLDAKIYTELDGEHVGKLHYVVLDPKTRQLLSIVINRGLPPKAVVISAEDIRTTLPDGGRIDLKMSKEQLGALPNNVEGHTVAFDASNNTFRLDAPNVSAVSSSTYGYNVLGGAYDPFEERLAVATDAVFYPEVAGYPEGSAIKAEQEVEYEQERLIPQEAARLRKHMNIVDKDGQLVGHLTSIYLSHNRALKQFTVKEGGLITEEAVFPAHWISDMGDDSISLTHTREEILKILFEV